MGGKKLVYSYTGSSFAVAAYVTSYISKVDKFSKVGWKDIIRELDSQIRAVATLHEGTVTVVESVCYQTGAEDAQEKSVKSFYEEVNRAVRKMVAEREVTAQEAALDAFGLPLIEFSCQAIYVQVRKPGDTTHLLRPKKDLENRRRVHGRLDWDNIVYDPPVNKYIKRK